MKIEIKVIRIKYIHCIRQQVLIAIKGSHIVINFNKPKPEILWSSDENISITFGMLNKPQTHVVNFVVLYNPFVYLTSNTQLENNFNWNITSHIGHRHKYYKYYNLHFDKKNFLEFCFLHLMNMKFFLKTIPS